MKRPSFQFYPGDWRRDPGLQSCGIVARGIWWEMLCLMHECEPYGTLSRNGVPLTDAAVAALIRVRLDAYSRATRELESAGVFSRTGANVIYSRRMVRDERIREVRAAAGKQGGNPVLLKQKEDFAYSKLSRLLNHASNLGPTPSSSSSSSSEVQDLTPSELETAPSPPPNPNGGVETSPKVKTGGQSWHDRAWVEATAELVAVQRRTNEPFDDWADRVSTALRTRTQASEAENERRRMLSKQAKE